MKVIVTTGEGRRLSPRRAHFWRKLVQKKFSQLKLRDDQMGSIDVIVGEAITNACNHVVGDGTTTMKIERSSDSLSFEVSNPSEGLPSVDQFPEDVLENANREHGRGRLLIDEMLMDLIEHDLPVDGGYCFVPVKGSNMGRTVFRLSVSL